MKAGCGLISFADNLLYIRDFVGGCLVGAYGHDGAVVAGEPIFVGFGVVGFFVVECACEPIEWFAVRCGVVGIFFGPASAGGTNNFQALRVAVGGEVDVEAYAVGESFGEDIADDFGDEGVRV